MGWPDDVQQDVGEERLPVPVDHADQAAAQVRSLINRLDELIVARADQCNGRLHMWAGPARDEWDLDFNLTQVELQDVIDRLQRFGGDVEDVLDAVRDHNRRVEADERGGGGGSW